MTWPQLVRAVGVLRELARDPSKIIRITLNRFKLKEICYSPFILGVPNLCYHLSLVPSVFLLV